MASEPWRTVITHSEAKFVWAFVNNWTYVYNTC